MDDVSREVYPADARECRAGHALAGGNRLAIGESLAMCRKCRRVGNRSYGAEWRNGRGQVFVFLPDHPRSRRDGFYPRSKLVMEHQVGRLLDAEERVYHVDEDAGNDDPDNLMLFATAHDMATHRSDLARRGTDWAARRAGWAE